MQTIHFKKLTEQGEYDVITENIRGTKTAYFATYRTTVGNTRILSQLAFYIWGA